MIRTQSIPNHLFVVFVLSVADFVIPRNWHNLHFALNSWWMMEDLGLPECRRGLQTVAAATRCRHCRIIRARRSPATSRENSTWNRRTVGFIFLVFTTYIDSLVYNLTERERRSWSPVKIETAIRCTSRFESSKPTPWHQRLRLPQNLE